jgi:hypothetical protein
MCTTSRCPVVIGLESAIQEDAPWMPINAAT